MLMFFSAPYSVIENGPKSTQSAKLSETFFCKNINKYYIFVQQLHPSVFIPLKVPTFAIWMVFCRLGLEIGQYGIFFNSVILMLPTT